MPSKTKNRRLKTEPLTDKQVIAKLRRKRNGATAGDLGTTALHMRRLEREGQVVSIGKRQSGKQGRPPILFAVPERVEVAAAA